MFLPFHGANKLRQVPAGRRAVLLTFFWFPAGPAGLAGAPGPAYPRAVTADPVPPFRWPHRVSYAECTLGNHVYHARYLDILDRARGEFFRHLGQPLAALTDAGVLLPVSEAWLRYKAAARYDDPVVVEIQVTELARVRVAFGFRMVHEDGRLLLEAGTVHACTTLEGRPQRLPEPLRAALAARLIPAGDSSSN